MGAMYYTALVVELVVLLCFEFGYGVEYIGLIIFLRLGVLLSLAGFLYPKTQNKLWAYIAMVGFAFFVPVGLLGMIAMRNKIDKYEKEAFLESLENE